MREDLPAEWERQVDVVRRALGEDGFGRVWAEGKTMTLEEAIADALEEESP